MSDKLGDTIYVDFTTQDPTTGQLADADAPPTAAVYEADGTTTTTAVTVTKRGSLTGDYYATFVASTANGFAAGTSYNLVVSATVGGVSQKAAKRITLDGKRVVDLEDLAAQGVRDAMQLAPTDAGDAEPNSIDSIIALILGDTGTDGVVVGSINPDAIADAGVAPDMDTYQARVVLFIDDANAADYYAVSLFPTGQPYTGTVGTPTIQVILGTTGADLIGTKALTQVGSTKDYYTKAQTTARLTKGLPYIAIVSASLDGATRTMRQPVGRDSAA